ncbi:MAG: site-2 protease family protein [Clostridiales Family XIII bacterium]|nr:site-2 protease family protein [Clostridiales Family XIII bacterium]
MFIVYAIIIFALLIFVHEFGHFITAKATGIKVKEFALGMGPKFFKFRRGETLFSLRVFPIGGFCAMEGEDEDSEDPHAFNNRPVPARALTLIAGSLMNILLAVILLSIIIFSGGQPSSQIDAVTAESPAASAGVSAGDTVLAIDGESVEDWTDISRILARINEGIPAEADTVPAVEITVLREDGARETVSTRLYRDADDGILKVGISPVMKRSPMFAVKSIGYGAEATWNMAKNMYDVLGKLFTGQVGMEQLTGPVGIVKTVGDSAKIGFVYVVQLAALISLNLGIVNLLPLPALDGGRILFLIIRLFTGNRISDRVEGRIHLIGFLLLIALMIYITVIDVDRFIVT